VLVFVRLCVCWAFESVKVNIVEVVLSNSLSQLCCCAFVCVLGV